MRFRRIKRKIQNKLIIVFSLFCLAIFSVSGFLHYWYTENGLDEELGKKLLAVANAATLQVNTELISKFVAGDERGRTYQNFKKKLIELRDVTDVERIYVIDSTGCSLLDTEEGVRISYAYPFLKFNQYEFDLCLRGTPMHSVLFESYDGKLYKTAFVPMRVNGKIKGAIAVDGSATFLYIIKQIEWHLLSVGIIGVVISIVIGYYFSRSISTPVKQLMQEAEKIGAGKLEGAIEIETTDEIGFLGKTMEKMRQNILKRDQYLKTMLAGVAHELRNPLGGVEIYSHLLHKELAANENKQGHAKKIIHEVDVMKRILSDFLEFARPRQAQPELCDVQKLIDEIHALLGPEIREKKIEFIAEIRERQLYADPGHLRQVLMNLIQNSVQSVNGKGRIVVTSKRTEDKVELVVEDNGSGIDDTIRDKIFDPFFTTKEKGSGLGLAIVKKLIEENGGDIVLVSMLNKGTRCVLSFPKGPK